ncbi:TPA: hypothetical protein NQG91_004040 [Klebsiella pneumoniae]|nr:hypothetical protein [Klebsiella pneumoniae]HCJ1280231.1 hypothetical protein [Klebsiella pneumoniae]HDU2679922.1 hypothetical protein [Klebsiella pneumoniae]
MNYACGVAVWDGSRKEPLKNRAYPFPLSSERSLSVRGGCRQLVEYSTVTLTLKVTLADLYLMSNTPVKTQLQ